MPPIPSATSSTQIPSISAPSASPFNPFQTTNKPAVAATTSTAPSSPFESVFKAPPAPMVAGAGGSIFGKKEEPVAASGLFNSAATGAGSQSNLFKSPATSGALQPLWSQAGGESLFSKAEAKAQNPFSGVFKSNQEGSSSEPKTKLEAKAVSAGPGSSIFGSTVPSSSAFGGIFTKGPSSSSALGLFAKPPPGAPPATKTEQPPPASSTVPSAADPPKNVFSSSSPPESESPGTGLFSVGAAPHATGLFARPKEKGNIDKGELLTENGPHQDLINSQHPKLGSFMKRLRLPGHHYRSRRLCSRRKLRRRRYGRSRRCCATGCPRKC